MQERVWDPRTVWIAFVNISYRSEEEWWPLLTQRAFSGQRMISGLHLWSSLLESNWTVFPGFVSRQGAAYFPHISGMIQFCNSLYPYLLRILVAFIAAYLRIYETVLRNLVLLYSVFYQLYLIRTKVKSGTLLCSLRERWHFCFHLGTTDSGLQLMILMQWLARCKHRDRAKVSQQHASPSWDALTDEDCLFNSSDSMFVSSASSNDLAYYVTLSIKEEWAGHRQ